MGVSLRGAALLALVLGVVLSPNAADATPAVKGETVHAALLLDKTESTNVCDAIRCIASSPPSTMDELNGPVMQDMAWAAAQCDSSQDSGVIDFDSGWEALQPDALTINHLRKTSYSVTNAKRKRSLQGAIGKDGFPYVTVTVTVVADVSGTAGSVPFGAHITATINAHAAGVPSSMSGHALFPWTGVLVTNANSNAILADADLFDGNPPYFIVGVSLDATPTDIVSVLAVTADYLYRIRAVMDGVRAVPSGLASTIRGAFLDHSAFPAVSAAHITEGRLWNPDNGSLTRGWMMAQSSSTPDEAEVHAIVDAIEVMATEVSRGLCEHVRAVNGSVRHSISGALFLAGDRVRRLSLSAFTSAVVQCWRDDKVIGILAVQLAASHDPTSAAVTWPVSVFVEDERAAVAITKGARLRYGGKLAGYVLCTIGGITRPFTALKTDIFGDDGVGMLHPDVSLGSVAPVKALLSSATQFLQQGNQLLDTATASLLSVNRVDEIFAEYRATHALPTLLSFLSFMFPKVVTGAANLRLRLGGASLDRSLSGHVSVTIDALVSARLESKEWSDVSWLSSLINGALSTAYARVAGVPALKKMARPVIDEKVTISDAYIKASLGGSLNATFAVDGSMVQLSEASQIDAQVMASATVKFTASGSLSPIFRAATFTWDMKNNETTSVLQSSVDAAEAIGQQLISTVDDLVSGDGPLHFENALAAVEHYISSNIPWAGKELSPTSLKAGTIGGFSIVDFWKELAQFVSGGTVAAADVYRALAAFCRVVEKSHPLVTLRPLISSAKGGSVRIGIRSSELQRFTVDEKGWNMLATSRFRGSVGVWTDAALTLSGNGLEAAHIHVKASADIAGFTCPFRLDMMEGVVVDGNMHAAIDMDSAGKASATLDVAARVILRQMDGTWPWLYFSVSGLSLHVNTDATMDEASAEGPRVEIKTSADFRQSYAMLLSMIKEVVVGAASKLHTGALGGPLPPMSASTAADLQAAFADASEKRIVPWLYELTDEALSAAIAFKSDVSTDALTFPMSIKATVNGRASIVCTVPVPTDKTIQALLVSFKTALDECKLSAFVEVRTSNLNEDKPNSGDIGLYPTISGQVWRMELDVSDGGLFKGIAPFSLSIRPSFTGWWDLAHAASAVLERESGGRVKLSLDYADASAVVPTELQAVYSAKLPLITLNLTASAHFSATISQDALSSIKTSGSPFRTELSLKGSKMVAADFGWSASCGVGSWMGLPTPAQLQWSTNMDGDRLCLDSPVPAENNTFDIDLTIQVRQASSAGIGFDVSDGSVRRTVTLPVGVPSSDALKAAFADLLPDAWRPMLTYKIVPADDLHDRAEQLSFVLRRFEVTPGTWVIPQGIAITRNKFPGLAPAMSQVPRYTNSLLLTHMSLSTGAHAVALADSASGVLGVLDVTAKTVKAVGQTTASIVLRSPTKPNAFLSALTSADRITDMADITWSLKTNVSVSSLDFGAVGLEIPILEGISVQLNAFLTSENFTSSALASAIVNWKASMSHPFDSIRNAYEQLASLNSLCGWLRAIESVPLAVSKSAPASLPLPFLTKSIAWVSHDTVGAKLTDIRTRVCSKGESLTVAVLCSILDSEFGSGTCKAVRLRALSLDLDLAVSISKAYGDDFALDMPKMFPNSGIPVGIGSSGGVAISVGVDAELRVSADWTLGEAPTIRLGKETHLTITCTADTHGAAKVTIGPISANFANLAAQLGIGEPVRLQVTVNGDGVPAVGISGKGRLSGSLNALGEYVCDLNIGVDLARIGDGSAWDIEDACDPSFEVAWERVLAKFESSIMTYYADAVMVVDHLGDGIEGLVGALGPILEKSVIPFVSDLLMNLVPGHLRSMVGPEIRRGFTIALTALTDELKLTSGKRTEGETMRLILSGLTKIMCDLLKPDACPSVPDADADELLWPMNWTTTLRPPVQSLSFDVGGGKVAQLDAQCDLDVKADFKIAFTIVHEKRGGITIRFDNGPAVKTDIEIGTPHGCMLEGRIGPIAAVLEADKISGVKASFKAAKVDGEWKPHFEADATLKGSLNIGLVGKDADSMDAVKESVQALPHFQSTLTIGWSTSLDNPAPTAPGIHFTGMQMCIGSLLQMLKSLSKPLNMVLGPVKDVIGKDKLLMRKLGDVSIMVFGRSMSILEFVVYSTETLCEGGCQYDGALEAADAIMSTFGFMDKLANFGTMANGCAAFTDVASFSIDPGNTDDIEPTITGDAPDFSVNVDGVEAEHTGFVTDAWSSLTESTSGVRLLLNKASAPKAITSLIAGKPFELVEVRFDPLVVDIGTLSWEIIVYSPPMVWVGVTLSASVRLDFPVIFMDTRGLITAFESGNLADLTGGLGIKIKKDDGSPYTPFTASVIVAGYAGVGFNIGPIKVGGEIQVGLHLTASIAFVSPDGDSVMYFDTITHIFLRNPQKALKLSMRIDADIELRLRACVKLWRWTKCWDFLKKDYHVPIWALQTADPTAPSQVVHDDGSYNADFTQRSVDGGNDGPWIVQILEGGVMGVRNAMASRALSPIEGRANPSKGIVRARGTPSGPHILDVRGTPAVAGIEVHPLAALEYTIGCGKETAVNVRLTRETLNTDVAREGASGASFQFRSATVESPACMGLRVMKPRPGMSYTSTGLPCAAVIETDANSAVRIGGQPVDYAGAVVLTNGTRALDVISLAVRYELNEGTVLGDGGKVRVEMRVPHLVNNITVATAPDQPGTLIINNVPRPRSATAQGGKEHDKFVVPNMRDLRGHTRLDGGGNRNEVQVTSVTPVGGMTTTLSIGTVVTVTNEDTTAFTYKHILDFVLNVIGRRGERTTTRLLGADSDAWVRVRGIADSSDMDYNITACDPSAYYNVQMEGAGVHTLHLGSNGVFNGLQCTVAATCGVEGSPICQIMVHAYAETQPIRVILHNNKAVFYNIEDSRQFLTLFHSGFTRMALVLTREQGVKTQVASILPTPHLEIHADFSDGDGSNNVVTVCKSHGAILATGSFRAVLGPSNSDIPCNIPVDDKAASGDADPMDSNPLVDVRGTFVAVNTRQDVPISIGMDSFRNGGQGFILSAHSLDPVLPDGTRPATRPPPNPPSQWMCGLMRARGAPEGLCGDGSPAATVLYVGRVHMAITTGAGDDSVFAAHLLPSLQFSLSTNDGKDTLCVADSGAVINADTGRDPDTLLLVAPVGPTTVRLDPDTGDDAEDDVEVWIGDNRAGFADNTIAPLGDAASGHFLRLLGYHMNDQTVLRRGTPPSPQSWGIPGTATARSGLKAVGPDMSGQPLHIRGTPVAIARDANSNIIPVSMSEEGTTVRMNFATGDIIRVDELASGCVLVLNGKSQHGAEGAAQYELRVWLPRMEERGIIQVMSDPGTDGVLDFIVPPSPGDDGTTVYDVGVTRMEPGGYVAVQVGTNIIKGQFSHVRVRANHTALVRIDHPFATPDFVVEAVGDSHVQVEMVSIMSDVLLSNASTTISSVTIGALLQNGFGFALAGGQTQVSIDGTGAGQDTAVLDDDCMDISSSIKSPASKGKTRVPPTNWFTSMATGLGLRNETFHRCQFALHSTGVIAVRTRKLTARNIDAVRNVREIQTDALIIDISETLVLWESLVVAMANVTVNGRFHISAPEATSLSITAPIEAHIPVDITCGGNIHDGDALTMTIATFGDDPSQSSTVSARAGKCDVLIVVADDRPNPRVRMHDAFIDSLVVRMQAKHAQIGVHEPPDNGRARNVTVSSGFLSVLHPDGTSGLWLAWGGTPPTLPSLQFVDGNHDVLTLADAKSAVPVHLTADVTGFALVVSHETGIGFTETQLRTDAQKRLFVAAPSSADVCFDVDDMLSPGFWLASSSMSAVVCRSKPALDRCVRKQIATLSIAPKSPATAFSSSDNDSHVVMLFGSLAQPKAVGEYDSFVDNVVPIMIATCAIGIFVAAFTGRFLAHAWIGLQFSAALGRAAMQATSETPAVAIAIAVQRVVLNFLSPWYCGGDAATESSARTLANALQKAAICLACVVVLLALVGLARSRMSGRSIRLFAWLSFGERMTVPAYLFFVMAAQIAHMSREAWDGLFVASVISTAILVVAMVYHSHTDMRAPTKEDQDDDDDDDAAPHLLASNTPHHRKSAGFAPQRASEFLSRAVDAKRGWMQSSHTATQAVVAILICVVSHVDLTEHRNISQKGAFAASIVLFAIASIATCADGVLRQVRIVENQFSDPTSTEARRALLWRTSIAVASDAAVASLGLVFAVAVYADRGVTTSTLAKAVWLLWMALGIAVTLVPIAYGVVIGLRRQAGYNNMDSAVIDARGRIYREANQTEDYGVDQISEDSDGLPLMTLPPK